MAATTPDGARRVLRLNALVDALDTVVSLLEWRDSGEFDQMAAGGVAVNIAGLSCAAIAAAALRTAPRQNKARRPQRAWDTARAMSQENVEIDRQNRDLEVLREVYSHWERGDFTFWEAFADDYVWKAVDAIESGEYTGIAEVSAAWRTWLQAWDGFSVEAEEVVAGSDGRYVVMQLFRGKGKASGLESEERSAAVVTMRDGLIARMEGFWDRDAALQAAGVERR